MEEHRDESMATLVSRLVADGKDAARSEVALVRARLGQRLALGRSGAIAAVVAIALFHLALTSLFVGLLLIVNRSLGPVWATVIVVGVTLLVSALFGFFAYKRLGAAFASEPAA